MGGLRRNLGLCCLWVGLGGGGSKIWNPGRRGRWKQARGGEKHSI